MGWLMRIIRLLGYPAAMLCFALLIVDGAHSLAQGTVVFLSIAETWELLGPYRSLLVSGDNGFGWGSTPPQPILVNQLQLPASEALQFPALLAMICLTATIFLIDVGICRLVSAIKHQLKRII